jgi:Fic family protein
VNSSDAALNAWPAVEYETLPWEPSASLPISRTVARRYRGPYPAAVVPRISELEVGLPPELSALVDEAANEVARFDAELGREIAPFSSVLLRSESTASSQIENLTASARAIAEAELQPFGSNKASLIVANTRAMTAALDLAHRIDADSILQMHEALLSPSRPDIAGKWRDDAVWIGGTRYGPHEADLVPPRSERVPDAIDDLVAFIDRDDVSVLAHAAVAHAQFETIHPFPDGNGRTGRALLQAQLRNKRLTRNVTVPVSAGLLTNTDTYFDALDQYRRGDPLPIIDQITRAAFIAIENGRQLVDELHAIRGEWDEVIKVRRGTIAWRIADLLLRHPVVNTAFVARELGIAAPNVYRALGPLVDAGVLVESTGKRRHQVWRAPEVLRALDQFAARAGRRARPQQK